MYKVKVFHHVRRLPARNFNDQEDMLRTANCCITNRQKSRNRPTGPRQVDLRLQIGSKYSNKLVKRHILAWIDSRMTSLFHRLLDRYATLLIWDYELHFLQAGLNSWSVCRPTNSSESKAGNDSRHRHRPNSTLRYASHVGQFTSVLTHT